MSMKCVRSIITGRVQAVGFRAWTTRKAREKNLTGWVMNVDDGSVEAIFYGKPEAVDEMLEECLDGPLPARVLKIETTECTDIPDLRKGFYQRRSV